ncbi:MAG: alpha-N-arabinofuranosidase, partial [Terracidiphilus sp.]
MRVRMAICASAVLCLGWCAAAGSQQPEPAVPARIAVTVNTREASAPISKYLYGGFIEEGGTLISRSLWSEMLDDRKFYFPLNSKVTPPPVGRRRRPSFVMGLRKWRPVGPDEVVTMDTNQPFVGDQSPRIALDSSTPHGIEQSGIALVKGKKYIGRIYLGGTPGSTVKVSLIWGDGASDRQTITFSSLTGEYKKFPLSFTAGADAEKGTFEIAGMGSGDFHIGTVSLMPADNIDGFRPDTIALLRGMHAGMWRLPGGNFISDW